MIFFFFFFVTVALHFISYPWRGGVLVKLKNVHKNATDFDIISMTKIQLNSSFYLIATLRPMAHVKDVAETNSNSTAPSLTRNTMTMSKQSKSTERAFKGQQSSYWQQFYMYLLCNVKTKCTDALLTATILYNY